MVIIKSREIIYMKIILDVSIDFHTINPNVELHRKYYKIDRILKHTGVVCLAFIRCKVDKYTLTLITLNSLTETY